MVLKRMRLAFALYKYFPYGGLARDFVRIAKLCVEKGHTVDVYVIKWDGDLIPEFNVHILDAKGLTNHAKLSSFHKKLNKELKTIKYDVLVGFNKIPGIDVYYAADPCYVERFREKSSLHYLNPRVRFYSSVERAVFGEDSRTVCLMISDIQAELFKRNYGTAENRLVALPPGIDPSRRRPESFAMVRAEFRKEHQFKEQDLVVLMVGSSFKTKGVDRAIEALHSLPSTLLSKTHLVIVGEGEIPDYQRLVKEKELFGKVHFMGGRSDVLAFLLGSDVLLHPARKENTGTVILEAMVAGLPMLVTNVCGYAKHVKKSKAGVVLEEPFEQLELNEQLEMMLTSNNDEKVSLALNYAENEDLYSMPEKAIEIIECVAKSIK